MVIGPVLLGYVKKLKVAGPSEPVHFIGHGGSEHSVEGGVLEALFHGKDRVRTDDLTLGLLGVKQVLDLVAQKELREREHFAFFGGLSS